jgi:hypothetical protein
MFKRMMVLSAIAAVMVLGGCKQQNREGGRYGKQSEQMQGTGGAGETTGEQGGTMQQGKSGSQSGSMQGTGGDMGSSGSQSDTGTRGHK